MASSSSAFAYSTFSTHRGFVSLGRRSELRLQNPRFLSVRASSDDSDCNVEECAPDKEVGKVSVEWLAGEKTKVAGTYPPRKKGWTGYVEKDTAGQTNIYSVEPVVYVAESGISSGSAGSSADGSTNTVAVAAGVGLLSVAAASLILLQVGKNNPPPQVTVDYSGPSLSYYIDKFKPEEIIVEASAPPSQEEQEPVVQVTVDEPSFQLTIEEPSVQVTEAPSGFDLNQYLTDFDK